MQVEDVGALAPLRFGEFVLDEAAFELRRAGRSVAIEPRALKLLLHLARNRQRAVPRSELAAILWPDRVVSETSLKEAVNLVRRAVGDAADAQSVVATLRGHGYRFIAAVTEMPATASARTNVALAQGESASSVTAQVEDSGQRSYPLSVEFVGQVTGFNWLTQIVVKLPDELANYTGDVSVSIRFRGVPSNKVLIRLKPPG